MSPKLGVAIMSGSYRHGKAARRNLQDINLATLEELRAKRKRGQITPPRPNAEPVDLPAGFWDGVEMRTPVPKQPANLRVDADILEFFSEGGGATRPAAIRF